MVLNYDFHWKMALLIDIVKVICGPRTPEGHIHSNGGSNKMMDSLSKEGIILIVGGKEKIFYQWGDFIISL